jgi:dihydropteroate synthase
MLVNSLENNYFKKKRSILYDGELVMLNRPLIMGILNVTSDSFYDGGRFFSLENATQHAEQLISEGADIIDVGAYSTRPGAADVSEQDEIQRLLPVVKEIKEKFPKAMISIDTFRAKVAQTIVDETGDCIINDISGGTLDKEMFGTVARLKVPYILMHIQGTPATMQQNPEYTNVTKEVIKDLSEKVYRLHELGVNDVIIDPGFGFGKTIDHNYELFNHLDAFRFFELPVLVGISRKSMIYKLFGNTPAESLNGTSVLNTLALIGGADILRVHDVKEAAEAVSIYEQLKRFAK